MMKTAFPAHIRASVIGDENGDPPENRGFRSLLTAITALPLDDLEALGEALLDFTAIDDLDAWPLLQPS